MMVALKRGNAVTTIPGTRNLQTAGEICFRLPCQERFGRQALASGQWPDRLGPRPHFCPLSARPQTQGSPGRSFDGGGDNASSARIV